MKLIVRDVVQRALTDPKFQEELVSLGASGNDTRLKANIEALLNRAAADKISVERLARERTEIKVLIHSSGLDWGRRQFEAVDPAHAIHGREMACIASVQSTGS